MCLCVRKVFFSLSLSESFIHFNTHRSIPRMFARISVELDRAATGMDLGSKNSREQESQSVKEHSRHVQPRVIRDVHLLQVLEGPVYDTRPCSACAG